MIGMEARPHISARMSAARIESIPIHLAARPLKAFQPQHRGSMAPAPASDVLSVWPSSEMWVVALVQRDHGGHLRSSTTISQAGHVW